MSIDARVVGVRKIKHENEVKLTLEDRPGGGPAGQQTLRILNTDYIKKTPLWTAWLLRLVGCDIWGGSGEIMLGDNILATREMYTGIHLVENWREVIDDYKR